MKKYIIKSIKDKIEAKHEEYASNYIAHKYQSTLNTPDAKKQVESAEHNMKLHLETIAFLKELLKKEMKG